MNKYIKNITVDGVQMDVFMGASILIEGLKYGIDLISMDYKNDGEIGLAVGKLGALGIHLGNTNKYPTLEDVLSAFPYHFLVKVATEIQKTFYVDEKDLLSEKK